MGRLNLIPTPVTRILSVFLPVIFVFCYTDANGFYDKKALNAGAYSITELGLAIEECQQQSHILDEQIEDTQKGLDWLILKIKRISDSGRKVPSRLKASVITKEKRMARLRGEKTRLEKNLVQYQTVLQAKTGKSVSKKNISQSDPIQSKPVQSKNTPVNHPDTSMAQAKITDITKAVKRAGLEDWVQVLKADGGCAKINTTLPILFSSGSAALAKEYKSFLKKLARFLKPYAVKVYVSGFADSDPIHTPKYPSNFELGAFRAANIVHEMVRYGLKPSIFKIGSTGEHRFAAKIPSRKKSFQRRAKVTVVFTG